MWLKVRSSQVFNLFQIIKLYFIRKVLNLGPLKNPLFRFSIIFVFLLILSGLTFIIYTFFEGIENQTAGIRLILTVYTVTILLWTLIIFIFVKMLFMKSTDFLKLTFTFPVTMQERNTALLIFEMAISILLISILSSSVIISLVIKYHFQFLPQLITCIFFTSITAYLLLQVVTKILLYIINIFKLVKLKDVFIIIFFSLIFFELYANSRFIVEDIILSYLDHKDPSFHIAIIWPWIMWNSNLFITSLIFLAVSICFVILVIIIPDNSYMSSQKYVYVSIRKKQINLFTSYLYSIMRKEDTLNYVAISYLVFFILFANGYHEYLLYSLLPIAFNGIYHFVNTNRLRKLTQQIDYSVLRDYIYLIGSQLINIVFYSIPMLICMVVLGLFDRHSIEALAVIVVSVLMFSLVGILFPPYEDNPFSIMISFFIIFSLGIFLAFMIFILQLSVLYNIILFMMLVCMVVYLSMLGLVKLKEESF